MDTGFIWLVVGEIIVIALVIIARIIFKKMEKKKINDILKYIDKKSKDKEINTKFQDCLDIIHKNNVDMKK